MAIFAELRRRNLFRVAALYIALGWAAVQIADVVVPMLGIPDWTVSFVAILVLLGFPVAMSFAWAFDKPVAIGCADVDDCAPPHNRRRLDLLLIGALSLVLALVLIDAYLLRHPVAPDTPLGNIGASIAVLPFVDMSPNRDQEYFTDGLTEELLNELARTESLHVTGRTSSFAFKGTSEDLRSIGEKLGVATLLEGSVRKQDNRIRVTVQLVKASDGFHLWSAAYDRDLTDVFAIQSEIADQVAHALRPHLLPDTAVTPTAAAPMDAPASTSNMEAYTSYLRGQHLLRSRRAPEIRAAKAEFARAIGLDPAFARAHAGMALASILLVEYGGAAELEGATIAAEHALALDPRVPDAWAAKALVARHRGQYWRDYHELLQRASEVSPQDSQLLLWLGNSFRARGLRREAIAAYEKAYAIDPLWPRLIANLALALAEHGAHDRARRLAEEVQALAPDQTILFELRSLLAWEAGHADEAVRWLARIPAAETSPLHLAQLSLAYIDLGDVEAAQHASDAMLALAPDTPEFQEWRIWYLGTCGHTEAALQYSQDAIARLGPHPKLVKAEARTLGELGRHTEALERWGRLWPAVFDAEPDFDALAPDDFALHAPLIVHALAATGAREAAVRLHAELGQFLVLPGGDRLAPRDRLLHDLLMAAALADRPAMQEALHAIDASEQTLPMLMDRWLPLQPHLDDPALQPVFARLDGRRRSSRLQLASEGL
jgi:TolB-like protein